jgi:hypothetical protein
MYGYFLPRESNADGDIRIHVSYAHISMMVVARPLFFLNDCARLRFS